MGIGAADAGEAYGGKNLGAPQATRHAEPPWSAGGSSATSSGFSPMRTVPDAGSPTEASRSRHHDATSRGSAFQTRGRSAIARRNST